MQALRQTDDGVQAAHHLDNGLDESLRHTADAAGVKIQNRRDLALIFAELSALRETNAQLTDRLAQQEAGDGQDQDLNQAQRWVGMLEVDQGVLLSAAYIRAAPGFNCML